MAKGHPDFFGMPTFPTFGSFDRIDPVTTIAIDGASTVILEAIGKGRLYGGYIYAYPGVTDHTDFYPLWNIDNELGSVFNPATDLAYGFSSGDSAPLKLVMCNYELDDFVWLVLPNWTFIEHFKLSMYNNTGADFACSGNLWWAKIL